MTAMLAGAGLALAVALPVAADKGGNDNKGDVWVDNVGQPSGPGHEMDPHLQCQDINLWGDKLADASGTYTIDGWNPSGSGTGDFNRPGYNQDQAWPGTKANPGNALWSYDQATGGSQVISVINVHELVDHATANGDAPVNKQGLHFKLQFSQDPQKHKTFWVDCEPSSPPPATDCDGDHDNSPTANGVCEGTSGGGVSGSSTAGSGVLAASTNIPSLPRSGGQAADSAMSPSNAGLARLVALAVFAALSLGVSAGLAFRR
jgi:hypothetical protein